MLDCSTCAWKGEACRSCKIEQAQVKPAIMLPEDELLIAKRLGVKQ